MGAQNVNDKPQINKGGGNNLQHGLTAEQLATLPAPYDTKDPAWYGIKGLRGGDQKPDRDTEVVRNEDGGVDGTVVNRYDYLIAETTHDTSDAALDLLEGLEDLTFPTRRFLPINKENAEGENWKQVWYWPDTRVEKDNTGMTIGPGVRTQAFQVRASLTQAMRDAGMKKPFYRRTLDINDQANWPPEFAGATDAAFEPQA